MGPPKSEGGRRTVAVDATTLGIVKSQRAQQNAETLALGAGYADDDLAFAPEDGAALRPEWVSKRFHIRTDAVKLPRIHLHDLRHTAASMALTAGVPMKVVSENLGYASLGITADVYSHVTTGLVRDTADRVAAALASSAMWPIGTRGKQEDRPLLPETGSDLRTFGGGYATMSNPSRAAELGKCGMRDWVGEGSGRRAARCKVGSGSDGTVFESPSKRDRRK